ncbi:MAG: single-stranded DNA-binding protein [bacterium]
MATGVISGIVTCREGDSPVTLKTLKDNYVIATFSMVDKEYFWSPDPDSKKGQFYNIEVTGKQAEIAADRLKRGDALSARGQLVQREWQGKTYLDVKNATLTFLSNRGQEEASGKAKMPF